MGTPISQFTPSATVPSGGLVPFIAPTGAGGLNPSANYVYDLGAGLNGKGAQVATLAALKALDITVIQAASLTDATLKGPFTWTTGDFTGQADDVNVIQANGVALTVGAWVRQKVDSVSFQQAGTDPTTRPASEKLKELPVSGDDFASLSAAVTEAASLGKGVQLLADTSLGSGSISFNAPSMGIEGQAKILTSTGTTPVLVCEKAAGTVTVKGPRFAGFGVTGKQGVRIGDPTTTIIDNDATNAFNLDWSMHGISAVGTGTGGGTPTADSIGIVLAKCFDGVDMGGESDGFETGLALVGCDINVLMAKRIQRFSKYGIYEAGTFNSGSVIGSQNTIMGMDIVGAKTGTGAISDKSTSAHPRRYNNYIELTTGAGGAVDFSVVGLKAFGTNNQTGGAATTIVSRDVRVDSQANAPFVYRIGPARSVHVRIEGIQTGDTSNTPSIFVNDAGTTLDYLPMHQASGRAARFYLEEMTFGPHWDGHRSKQGVTPNGDGFRVTAENASSVVYNSIVTGANGVANFRGQQIIIPPGNTGKIGIFPDGLMNGNRYFAAGQVYEVTLLARSSAASGDTIEIQQAGLDSGGIGFGTSPETRDLTNQFRPLRVLISGRPANSQMCGFNVKSATATGVIEFTLSWREVTGLWTAPLVIGGQYVWSNAATGKTYRRSTAALPTSDTDGTVIGADT